MAESLVSQHLLSGRLWLDAWTRPSLTRACFDSIHSSPEILLPDRAGFGGRHYVRLGPNRKNAPRLRRPLPHALPARNPQHRLRLPAFHRAAGGDHRADHRRRRRDRPDADRWRQVAVLSDPVIGARRRRRCRLTANRADAGSGRCAEGGRRRGGVSQFVADVVGGRGRRARRRGGADQAALRGA